VVWYAYCMRGLLRHTTDASSSSREPLIALSWTGARHWGALIPATSCTSTKRLANSSVGDVDDGWTSKWSVARHDQSETQPLDLPEYRRTAASRRLSPVWHERSPVEFQATTTTNTHLNSLWFHNNESHYLGGVWAFSFFYDVCNFLSTFIS